MEFIRKCIKYGGSLMFAALVSYFSVGLLMNRIIVRYSRLNRVLSRFAFTEVLLVVAMTLILWLFYLQWSSRTLWPIYWYLAYSLYACLLFVMLFTKVNTTHAFSINPFDFLNWDPGVLEFLLNIVTFIPLGAWYGARAGKLEFVIIALVTILGIETIQYVFYLGIFDTSDILANFLGCAIGYWCYQRLRGHFLNIE